MLFSIQFGKGYYWVWGLLPVPTLTMTGVLSSEVPSSKVNDFVRYVTVVGGFDERVAIGVWINGRVDGFDPDRCMFFFFEDEAYGIKAGTRQEAGKKHAFVVAVAEFVDDGFNRVAVVPSVL